MAFSYSVDQCSVSNRALLEAFRAKRIEWLGWLEGDPVHSIFSQISAMLWHDAAYRSFNEARRFAAIDKPTSAIAPILGEFLDVGYLATQMLAVAKLTEVSPKDPKKAVISLRRLLDDLKQHSFLFTRENFVSYDGLPYEWEQLRDLHIKNFTAGVSWRPTQGPEAWEMAELNHRAFDRLAGCSSDTRRREDRIDPHVFVKLLAVLERREFSDIRELRNKFLAHAADSQNRPASQLGITLQMLSDIHRYLIQVTHVASSIVLNETTPGGVPTPQFDQFRHLELNFVPRDRMDELFEFWNDHSSVRDSWLRSAETEVLGGGG